MYLDETATKIFAFLIAALIVMVFSEFAFLYETNKENKELRKQNRKLRRYIADTRTTDENPHDKYRAEFLRNMRRNTPDPIRHVKEGNYDL